MNDWIFFWKNLKNLKDFWQVSITGICQSLNEAVPGLDMTKGKLDYIFRCRPDTVPADGVADAANKLYCHGCGLQQDEFNILGHELDADGLAFLATGQHLEGCSMDKDAWVRNFWSNYRWVEACYQLIGRPVPGWKKAGHYTYTLRKGQRILPPVDVIIEFGGTAGLESYPAAYLKRFSGRQMLLAYRRIAMPFISDRPRANDGDAAEACGRLAVDAASVHMMLTSFPVHLDGLQEKAVKECVPETAACLRGVLSRLEMDIELLWEDSDGK